MPLMHAKKYRAGLIREVCSRSHIGEIEVASGAMLARADEVIE
jgi:hypothetical protein